METADYEICVGASVADIRLTSQIHVTGTEAPLPYGGLHSYESGNITSVSDEEFKKLLGHDIPDGSWSGELTRNDAICQLYYAKTGPT